MIIKNQNYQKALELKTEIISQLVECVMDIMVNGDFYHDVLKNCTKDSEKISKIKTDLEYKKKDWKTKRCVIGTKLHAYFPNDKFNGKGFHKYSDSLADRFIVYCFNEKVSVWEGVRKRLLKEKEEFIKEILETEITVFSPGLKFVEKIMKWIRKTNVEELR